MVLVWFFGIERGEKREATPYHENTKGGKHERGEGYRRQSALFRAFQVSCFRDWFLIRALKAKCRSIPVFKPETFNPLEFA
jgi:hypothetical protein